MTAPKQANKTTQFVKKQFRTQQVVTPLIMLVILIALLLLVLAYVFDRLEQSEVFSPEISLPLALIVGTVALLMSIGVIVIVFARLSLDSWKHALGLPEGSVRAIIALLLILLFFISAIFLYADVASPGDPRSLVGVDATRLAAIPTEEIIELAPNSDDDSLFDVTLRSTGNAASEDLAKQIVTTVSTLVVAIAAFYFGTKSVETAKRHPDANRPGSEETREDDPKPNPAPTITRLSPPAATKGGGPFGLTIIGTGFVEGARAQLADDLPIDAIWVDATKLSVEIATDLEAAVELKVINPDGTASDPRLLEVTASDSPTTPTE